MSNKMVKPRRSRTLRDSDRHRIEQALAANDIAAAAQLADAALAAGQTDPMLLYLVSWQREEAGDYPGAHRLLQRALAMAPDDVFVLELEDAPGGRTKSVNPARKDETVAEVLLGDAGTFVEACRAARGAQGDWAAVPAPIRAQVIKKVGRIVERNKEALARLHPDLGELVRRIGGLQVRNAGTIGGNIANGSPIGDMPPALIALGATLTLRRGGERRTMPLEDFFIAYGDQDLRDGEFVEGIQVPPPHPQTLVRFTKLAKRFDSDISAVLGAFAIRIEDGVVLHARIAFGGMAAIPARARFCEVALVGAPRSEATIEAAARALTDDYTPLDDVRGSAAYRLTVARNLLRRLWHEAAEQVSVLDPALTGG